MGWKIIFAPQALEELEQIVQFIAQDDEVIAESERNAVAANKPWPVGSRMGSAVLGLDSRITTMVALSMTMSQASRAI